MPFDVVMGRAAMPQTEKVRLLDRACQTKAAADLHVGCAWSQNMGRCSLVSSAAALRMLA